MINVTISQHNTTIIFTKNYTSLWYDNNRVLTIDRHISDLSLVDIEDQLCSIYDNIIIIDHVNHLLTHIYNNCSFDAIVTFLLTDSNIF